MIPLWRRRAGKGRAVATRSAAGEPVVAPREVSQLLAGARARLGGLTSDKLVWFASFGALGTADLAMTYAQPGRLLNVLRGLGLAGAAGLTITAGHDLRASRGLAEKLDAANDLAWGLQGLAGLALPAWARAQAAAVALGVAGAAVQTGVGVLRIGQGLRSKDGPTLKLGLLDLGGGLLWLGWDLVGLQQPLYLGSYVVLMLGREAYANRTELRGAAPRIRAGVRRLGGRLEALVAEVYEDLGRPGKRPAP